MISSRKEGRSLTEQRDKVVLQLPPPNKWGHECLWEGIVRLYLQQYVHPCTSQIQIFTCTWWTAFPAGTQNKNVTWVHHNPSCYSQSWHSNKYFFFLSCSIHARVPSSSANASTGLESLAGLVEPVVFHGQ